MNLDYVVLKRFNRPDPAVQPLADTLARRGRLLAQFSPYRAEASPAVRATVSPFVHNTALRIDPALARPGPVIEVWQIARSPFPMAPSTDTRPLPGR